MPGELAAAPVCVDRPGFGQGRLWLIPRKAQCGPRMHRSPSEQTSGGGWKVLVPENQVLDEGARESLRQAAEADPYSIRMHSLALDRPWMELLREGKRLVIDIEEWINKTSGRGKVTLAIDNE